MCRVRARVQRARGRARTREGARGAREGRARAREGERGRTCGPTVSEEAWAAVAISSESEGTAAACWPRKCACSAPANPPSALAPTPQAASAAASPRPHSSHAPDVSQECRSASGMRVSTPGVGGGGGGGSPVPSAGGWPFATRSRACVRYAKRAASSVGGDGGTGAVTTSSSPSTRSRGRRQPPEKTAPARSCAPMASAAVSETPASPSASVPPPSAGVSDVAVAKVAEPAASSAATAAAFFTACEARSGLRRFSRSERKATGSRPHISGSVPAACAHSRSAWISVVSSCIACSTVGLTASSCASASAPC